MISLPTWLVVMLIVLASPMVLIFALGIIACVVLIILEIGDLIFNLVFEHSKKNGYK